MDRQRVALVVDGMGNLGEAVCRKLAATGHRVVTTHPSGDDHAQAWVAAQKKDGYDFAAYKIDIRDYDACSKGVMAILGDTERIDLLINNAMVAHRSTWPAMTYDDWRTLVECHIDGVFNMTKPVLHGMLESGWGRIVNIAAIDSPDEGAIRMEEVARTGVHGFTKALALELAAKGITVNTVSPGYLRNGAAAQVPQQVLEQQILPGIPLGRLGEPEEIAALVAYLCSDDAGFVTGANIAINGGQHMQ